MKNTPSTFQNEEKTDALFRISQATSNYSRTLVSIFGASDTPTVNIRNNTSSSRNKQQQQQQQAPPVSPTTPQQQQQQGKRQRRDPSRRIRFVDEDEDEEVINQILNSNNTDQKTPFNSANNTSSSMRKIPWNIKRHYLHVRQNRDLSNPTTYSSFINPKAVGAELLTFPSDKHLQPIRPGEKFTRNKNVDVVSASASNFHLSGDAADSAKLFPTVTCPNDALNSFSQNVVDRYDVLTNTKQEDEGQDDQQVPTENDETIIENEDFSWLDSALVDANTTNEEDNTASGSKKKEKKNDASSSSSSDSSDSDLSSTSSVPSSDSEKEKEEPKMKPSLPLFYNQIHPPTTMKNSQYYSNMILSGSFAQYIASKKEKEDNNNNSKSETPMMMLSQQPSSSNHLQKPLTPAKNAAFAFSASSNKEPSSSLNNEDDDANSSSSLCLHPLHSGITSVVYDVADLESRGTEHTQKALSELPPLFYDVALLCSTSNTDDSIGFNQLILWSALDVEIQTHLRELESERAATRRRLRNMKRGKNVFGVAFVKDDDENGDDSKSSNTSDHQQTKNENQNPSFSRENHALNRLIYGDDYFLAQETNRTDDNDNDNDDNNVPPHHDGDLDDLELIDIDKFKEEAGTIAALKVSEILVSKLVFGIKTLCGGCFNRRHFGAIFAGVHQALKEMRFHNRNAGRNNNNNTNVSSPTTSSSTNPNLAAAMLLEEKNEAVALFTLLRDAFEVCENIFVSSSFFSTTTTKTDDPVADAQTRKINHELLKRKLMKELDKMAQDEKRETMIQLVKRQNQEQQKPLSVNEILSKNKNTNNNGNSRLQKPIWTTLITEPLFEEDPTLRTDIENVFLRDHTIKKNTTTNDNTTNTAAASNENEDSAPQQEKTKNEQQKQEVEGIFDEWIFETTERGKARYSSVPTIMQSPILTLILLFARPNRWMKKVKEVQGKNEESFDSNF